MVSSYLSVSRAVEILEAIETTVVGKWFSCVVGITVASNIVVGFSASLLSVDNRPIGIFDSGLGGLTVARALIDKLPNENVVYLGDTKNTPYGPRPISQVRELTLAALDTLVEYDVKMLVIACNTATAAALRDARERYEQGMGIPVIEVITPAAKTAVGATRNGSVGVIGTVGTVDSRAYPDALAAVPGVDVHQQACPRFVDFVERGETTGDAVTAAAKEYLQPLKDSGVDTVVLGCTHYPLLSAVIGRELGPGVQVVSSSEATAVEAYSRLVDEGLLHGGRADDDLPSYRFLATDDSADFARLARRFLGPEVQVPEVVPVEDRKGK